MGTCGNEESPLASAARMFGGFAASAEAKIASMSEAPSSSHFERAASAFRYIQLQRLESPVISLSRSKQKALQGRELQCPAILNEPLPLLNYPAPVTRTVGHFAPSCEAKIASSSGAPMPSCSEQVTSAFKLNTKKLVSRQFCLGTSLYIPAVPP